MNPKVWGSLDEGSSLKACLAGLRVGQHMTEREWFVPSGQGKTRNNGLGPNRIESSHFGMCACQQAGKEHF